MTRAPSTRGPSSVAATLAERCASMSLCAWHADVHGTIIANPKAKGLVGILLSAGFLTKLISDCIRRWGGAREPMPAELFPGCWLVGIHTPTPADAPGYLAAIVLGPEALQAEPFAAWCQSAQADAPSARRALAPLAVHDRASVDRTLGMLRWAAEDLNRLAESAGTIESFTGYLGDAYETIDLLYSIGNSLGQLPRPEQFVRACIFQLHETLLFEWTALLAGPGAGEIPGVGGKCFVHGFEDGQLPDAEQRIAKIVATMGDHPERVIVEQPLADRLDTQVVVQPIAFGGRIVAHLLAGDKRGDDPQVSSYDTGLIEATSRYLGAFLENASLYAQQQTMFLGTLRALTSAIDAKDPYTHGHSERVAHIARGLAGLAGLTEEACERIHIAGLVHDVGKIGVPEAVLTKPGRLTDEEFEIIKRHPTIGHRIIRDIPLMSDVLPGVLHHHERWDGRGYPHGIAGEAIPLMARLIGLADTFDAMSSTRSYRPALSRERVLDEIQKCAGTQFDPALALLFPRLDLAEYDRMLAANKAQAMKLGVAA